MKKKKQALHDTATAPEAAGDDMEVAAATPEAAEDYAEDYMEAAATPGAAEDYAEDDMEMAAATHEAVEDYAEDDMDVAAAAPEVAEDEIEEPAQWLEIDGETIVGVHSYRCQSELVWGKYEGEEEVMPGQLWKNNKVVQPKVEYTAEDVQAAATQHINEVYPTWKQLNILREGNKNEIDKMGQFIDAVRAWSNKPKVKIEDLKKIKP